MSHKAPKPTIYLLEEGNEIAVMETCDSAESEADVHIASFPRHERDALYQMLRYFARRGIVEHFRLARSA
jgi:hypothetical protein